MTPAPNSKLPFCTLGVSAFPEKVLERVLVLGRPDRYLPQELII